VNGFFGLALADCGRKLQLVFLHLADERVIFGFFCADDLFPPKVVSRQVSKSRRGKML
jgi:hypothetical protein